MSGSRPPNGFTLLEMLVAVAVLSIAALALVRLDAFSLHATADLSRSAIARIVAANAAVDAATDPAAPAIGSHASTVTNGGLRWRVEQQVQPTADPALLRIDIAVSGASASAARLTIIRASGQ